MHSKVQFRNVMYIFLENFVYFELGDDKVPNEKLTFSTRIACGARRPYIGGGKTPRGAFCPPHLGVLPHMASKLSRSRLCTYWWGS